jgi:hypothetical protein
MMINVVVFLLLVLVTIRCYVFGGAIPIFAITVTKPRHDKLWVEGKHFCSKQLAARLFNLYSRSAH